MAEALATGGDRRDFWKEIDNMEGRSRQIPPQIDNITHAKGINNLLSNKNKELLNSVPSDPSVINRIDEKITRILDHIIVMAIL